MRYLYFSCLILLSIRHLQSFRKIEEYLLEDGPSPYKKRFDELAPQAATEVTIARLQMEPGLTSAIKWFDGIEKYQSQIAVSFSKGKVIRLVQYNREIS